MRSSLPKNQREIDHVELARTASLPSASAISASRKAIARPRRSIRALPVSAPGRSARRWEIFTSAVIAHSSCSSTEPIAVDKSSSTKTATKPPPIVPKGFITSGGWSFQLHADVPLPNCVGCIPRSSADDRYSAIRFSRIIRFNSVNGVTVVTAVDFRRTRVYFDSSLTIAPPTNSIEASLNRSAVWSITVLLRATLVRRS